MLPNIRGYSFANYGTAAGTKFSDAAAPAVVGESTMAGALPSASDARTALGKAPRLTDL